MIEPVFHKISLMKPLLLGSLKWFCIAYQVFRILNYAFNIKGFPRLFLKLSLILFPANLKCSGSSLLFLCLCIYYLPWLACFHACHNFVKFPLSFKLISYTDSYGKTLKNKKKPSKFN